jgi:hypothetical protein
MTRTKRGTNLDRSGYLDQNDFARDLLRGGGPGLKDLGGLGVGTGFYSQLLTSIWGGSRAEFDAAIEHEHAFEQRERPHVFVRKWQTRRR